MYPEMQQDILALVTDAAKVKHGLASLKQDYGSWNRDREKKDMAELLGFLKKLEIDISLMEADWIGLNCSAGGKNDIFPAVKSLHQAFVNLNRLFNDLKGLNTELNQNTIRSDSLKKFEIDWCRFGKTLQAMLASLGD